MKRLKLIGAGLIMNIAVSQIALAAGWRFCIATSGRVNKIYMTDPFLTSTSMESLERDFDQLLDHLGRVHDSVQCPTGPNEQRVRTMRQYAVTFNQQAGKAIVFVDWKPALSP